MIEIYTLPAPATSATSGSVRYGLLAAWAIFTLAAAAFVLLLGTNAPYADEWEFVPVLVGEEEAGPWLWKQHNEHRFPFPRLIYLCLFKLTHDFRAGMLLQITLLSALARFLMLVACQLRGRPDWADAFFPVSLLHIGHWENFLMGYQICFVLFTVFTSCLLVVAFRTRPETIFRSGLVAAGLSAGLALTGGSGLVAALPATGWVLYLSVLLWRSGSNGRAMILVGLGFLPLLYLASYLFSYQKPPGHPDLSSSLLGIGQVAGEVLAMSLGMGLSAIWWLVSPAIVFLSGATAVLLVRVSKAHPERRPAAVGVLAAMAGVIGVALAIGVGRGGWGGGMGLWSRYGLLAWPLLAAVYLAWVGAGRKWIPIALCVAAALAFPGNMFNGMAVGAKVKSEFSAIEVDNTMGLSPEQIVRAEDGRVERGQGRVVSVLQSVDSRSVRGISLLRASRIGIFGK